MKATSESLTQAALPKAIGLLVACFVVIIGGVYGSRPGTILTRALIAGVASVAMIRFALALVRFTGVSTAIEDE